MQDILTYYWIVQRLRDVSQGEGHVVKFGENGRSSKREGKKSNRVMSKFRAKDGCFECESKDHWKKNCPTWGQNRNKWRKLYDLVKVAEDSDGELLIVDSIVNTDVVSISSKISSFDLILDSGCSYHICSNESWFDTYKVDDNDEVVIRDGLVCRVKARVVLR